MTLKTKVGHLEFKNPIMAASGTFGYGLEFASQLDLNQLGGFVTKGLSMQQREGNKPPRIHETACGMLNSIGLHNVGAPYFCQNILPSLQSIDTIIATNVYGQNPDEFVEVATFLDQHQRIDVLEINVSCPNVKKGGLDLGTDPNEVFTLVSRIRKKTHKPLWVKLTPNVTDIVSLAKAAKDGGCDALVLINSVRGMAIDWKSAKPHLHTYMGGLSGPAIKPIALAKVYEVSKNVDIPIVGVGGICNAHDVLEFMVCGASAVQIGTMNFVDTQATINILNELKDLLDQNNISNIQSLIGKIHRG